MAISILDAGPLFGARHVQTLLLFFATTFASATEAVISVAVVAMTKKLEKFPDIPYYNWTNTSVILSSFFWGHAWLQIPVGHFGQKYGVKYIFLTMFGINLLMFTLIPPAAEHFGSVGVIVCSIFQGLSQGCVTPTLTVMIGVWVPVEERTRLYSVAYTGYGMGSMLGYMLAGYISDSKFGWPMIFYLFGAFGFLFLIMWWMFAYNSPASHPSITKSERKYIETSLQLVDDKKPTTPWKAIFTNIHFYAACLAYCGYNYAVAMNTVMPTYLSNVWNFDVSTIGLLTSIPILLYLILNLPFAGVADYLISNHYLSTGATRKLFECMANWGTIIYSLAFCIIPADKTWCVIVLLALRPILSSMYVGGAHINLSDLSPRFCGVMAAFCNTVAQIFTASAPLIVQFVVTDQTDPTQWNMVFIIKSVVLAITSISFAIFGSGERQPFDGPNTPNIDKIKRMSIVSVGKPINI